MFEVIKEDDVFAISDLLFEYWSASSIVDNKGKPKVRWTALISGLFYLFIYFFLCSVLLQNAFGESNKQVT